MFSHLESLVRWGVFEHIEVAFLPVAHPHENIDQTFSRTSIHLRFKNATTLDDFHYVQQKTF